ncbi:hypothetical protein CEF21_18610 [Bacillus sp. FJAT-42376]|uniref:hypothetical protein n=1 Tax=Bacillus sp. FJAT-42376 TaxID=2014076 RepID=UPI000F4E80BA|nr:hypothetical protein [Bacillus sp. FJAT-42376]AZB44143.1 hypothetical protein CEF21_18610 [Bacillus sp. FJAT-42376]
MTKSWASAQLFSFSIQRCSLRTNTFEKELSIPLKDSHYEAAASMDGEFYAILRGKSAGLQLKALEFKTKKTLYPGIISLKSREAKKGHHSDVLFDEAIA